MGEIQSEAFGLSARGGLHVPSARLWLDGWPRDGIAFRSDFEKMPRRIHRILCSPVLAALTQRRNIRPLAVPFERPFSLGPLTLELLPAGSAPGASMLHMQIGAHALLYAAAARPLPSPTSRPVHWASAEVLVLDAELAEEPHLSPVELAVEVRAFLDAPPPGGAVWLFDHRSSALDIARLVGDALPIWAHAGVVKLAERARRVGIELPPIQMARRRPKAGGLVLWPMRLLSTLCAGPLSELPRVLIAEGADAEAAALVGAGQSLRFAHRASGQELDELAEQGGIEQVLAFGRGAHELCQRLEGRGYQTIELVEEAQLSLV